QHKNRCAETKARRTRRDKGQQGECRRHLANASKVMLGHEARMEPERFGLDVGLDEIEEAFSTRRYIRQPRRCRAAEQSKSHGEDLSEFAQWPQLPRVQASASGTLPRESTPRLRSALATGGRVAVLDIEHSLRWHDPGRFNGFVLSRHLAGTPVDAICLACHALSRNEPPVPRSDPRTACHSGPCRRRPASSGNTTQCCRGC